MLNIFDTSPVVGEQEVALFYEEQHLDNILVTILSSLVSNKIPIRSVIYTSENLQIYVHSDDDNWTLHATPPLYDEGDGRFIGFGASSNQ